MAPAPTQRPRCLSGARCALQALEHAPTCSERSQRRRRVWSVRLGHSRLTPTHPSAVLVQREPGRFQMSLGPCNKARPVCHVRRGPTPTPRGLRRAPRVPQARASSGASWVPVRWRRPARCVGKEPFLSQRRGPVHAAQLASRQCLVAPGPPRRPRPVVFVHRGRTTWRQWERARCAHRARSRYQASTVLCRLWRRVEPVERARSHPWISACHAHQARGLYRV